MSYFSKQDLSHINITAFLDDPAGVPPAGVQQDLLHPYRDATAPLAVGGVCVGIMLCLSACRIYSKCWLAQHIWWDDFAYAIGVLGTVVAYIANILAHISGSQGYHIWDITVRDATANVNFISFYMQLVGYIFGSVGFKAACLLMLWILFSGLRWMRWTLRIGGSLLICANFVLGIAMVGSFTPSPGQTWLAHNLSAGNSLVVNGYLAISGLSLFTDLFILLVPIPAVLGLHMNMRRRIGVLIVLTAGTNACVASALNVYFRVKLYSSSDITYIFSQVATVTVVELAVGACCSATPATAHVLNSLHWFREARSRVSNSLASYFGATDYRATVEPQPHEDPMEYNPQASHRTRNVMKQVVTATITCSEASPRDNDAAEEASDMESGAACSR